MQFFGYGIDMLNYPQKTSMMLNNEAKQYLREYDDAGLTPMEALQMLELEHRGLVEDIRYYGTALSNLWRAMRVAKINENKEKKPI